MLHTDFNDEFLIAQINENRSSLDHIAEDESFLARIAADLMNSIKLETATDDATAGPSTQPPTGSTSNGQLLDNPFFGWQDPSMGDLKPFHNAQNVAMMPMNDNVDECKVNEKQWFLNRR